MSCQGWYYLGNPASQELLGIYKFHDKAQRYTQPVKLANGEEWALGSCTDSETIEGATYQIFVNESSKAEVRDRMREHSQKFNTTQIKPLTVINLFLDSISRKNFYRHLPATTEFLNALSGDKFRVFDYKLHEALGDNSVPNLYPLWTGEFFTGQSKEEREYNKVQVRDILGDQALWNLMRSRGWATLFAAEFCNNYFAYAAGKKPAVHHLASRFWCAAEAKAGFNDISTAQRCIGNKNSHQFMLNYTLQFVQEYSGLNKYAHVMSVTAHESTGTVIRSLDSDLRDFLQKITETSDELVLFLAADHGMRYGEWYKLENGGQEHRMPMLFVVVSQGLLKRLGHAAESLAFNANRLFTKFDMRSSIEHLSLVPYLDSYRSTDLFPNASEAVSIFLHKISDERNCESVGIDAEYCICPRYINYTSTDGTLVKHVAKTLVELINAEAVYNNNTGFNICRRISIDRITMAQWVSQQYKILVKVNFTVNEAELVQFQGTAMVFGTPMKTPKSKESYGFLPYYYSGKRMLRVIDVKNTYANKFCYEISLLKGVSPNLCICRSLEEIEVDEQELVREIEDRYTYKISRQSESCERACERRGMRCSEIGSGLMNTCGAMTRRGVCYKCNFHSPPEEYGINGFVCNSYGKFIEDSCSAVGINRRVCGCEAIKEKGLFYTEP